jgi:putative ABC transport system permease protein
MTAPPRIAHALLRRILGDEDFEAISGDLEELFYSEAVPRLGVRRARLWYGQQVASILISRAADRLRGAIVSDSPVDQHTPKESTMSALRQDLRYAVRALRKQPGFTMTAVLTLALGVGANVAIFAVVNAILYKPLPFLDPDRLMSVTMQAPDRETPGVFSRAPWSYPKYLAFREQQQAFASTAIFMDNDWNITGTSSPDVVSGELVESTYFEVLGIAPEHGRTFTADETRTPGSAPLVVLSAGFWQRRFGGDPAAIGGTIGLNGVPHTIVGIMPARVRGLTGLAEVWVPVTTLSAANLGEAYDHSYWMVARRRDEVGVEQAQAAVRLLGERIAQQYSGGFAQAKLNAWGAAAAPLDDERVDPLIRRSALLMLAAVGAVLLIVCVNLANLTLVRAFGRQREVAIRLAVGASRLRIVRQLMTESLLLAAVGSVCGLGVAYGLLHAAASLLPDLRLVLPPQTGGLTRVGLTGLGLDLNTLLFAVLAGSGAAVLFGLGPAWRASRRDLSATIKGSGGADGYRRGWSGARSVLVVVEIALALVILSAGGLMIKSVAHLQSTELGFRSEGVLTARLALLGQKYDSARATRLLRDLVERLSAHGNVAAVAYGSCAPLAGPCNGTTMNVVNRPVPASGVAPEVSVLWASPTYFDTLGIRLVRGRLFDERDRVGQPKVVVINETAARAIWPNEDPIGHRVTVGQGGFGDGAEIVGIVADVRYGAIERSIGPDVYLPLLQSTRRMGVIFLKSRTDSEALVPILRQEVRGLDPDLPLMDIKMMDARFGDATWRTRTSAWLLGVFAMLALTLAAIGIYGVVSQGVAQRSRELGVRVALGAGRADILRLVLGRAVTLAVVGVAIGVAAAIPAMRLLTALLYQVSPGDPGVLGLLAVVLLAAVTLASYVPARRATKVDALDVMRAE